MIRTLALAGLAALSTLASAAPITYQAVIRAQLEPLGSERYDSAQLYMDGREGKLELTLQGKMPSCPEGRMCAQVMPEPQTYTLEGATSEENSCGIIITTAKADLRPVDGAMTKITVRHNQNNTCPTFRALKAIEVTFERAYYDRLKGQEVHTADSFETDNVALINPAGKGGDVEFQGQVNGVSYENKILTLDLSYSGGCKEHAFDLKWGDCKRTKVLNSAIDQCEVTILHTEGSDDSCEAYITKKHTIDLSGLAQAYVIKIGDKKVLVH